MKHTIFEVARSIRICAYYPCQNDRDFKELQPGMDWAHEVFKPCRREWERWPQAWAKALFLLINAANKVITTDPDSYVKLAPGVAYVIKYMEERQRKSREKWERDNPELLAKEMASYERPEPMEAKA